jgi:acetate---CoA ligase (ADP-forming)
VTDAETTPGRRAVTERHSVECLLRPQSVAFFGVSSRSKEGFQATGKAAFDHLRRYGYEGDIYIVHPAVTEIDGVRAYQSLADVPQVPDCAVIAVPSDSVAEVLQGCGDAGIPSALILSSGFSELGTDTGRRLEDELRIVAARTGIRLLGPNTTGVINVGGHLSMTMSSLLATGAELIPGDIGLVTQSGALASCIVDRAQSHGVGFSHIIALGNAADLNETHVIDFLAEDPATQAVALHVEDLHDAAHLRRACGRLATAGKQLVTLVGGRTVEGERRAASHTGRLVGRTKLITALLDALDVRRVDDLDQLWRSASALRGIPVVTRIAVVTISGGLGVLAADLISESRHGELSEFSATARAALGPLLPAVVPAVNPLDLGAGFALDGLPEVLRILATDPDTDAIAICLPVVSPDWQARFVRAILNHRAVLPNIPVVACWYGGEAIANSALQLRRAGIEISTDFSALAALAGGRAVASRRVSTGTPEARVISVAPTSSHVEEAAIALVHLGSSGLPVARMKLAADAADAVAAAMAVGFPVALKASLPGAVHKSDWDGIRLGVSDADQVVAAVKELRHAARCRFGLTPKYLVQEMVPPGLEVVLSLRAEGSLGGFVGIGAGGTTVELLGDIAYWPLPLATSGDLDRLLNQLRLRPLFDGYRGSPAMDVGWLRQTINSAWDLMLREGLREIEINPLIMYPHGGVVVDALIQ